MVDPTALAKKNKNGKSNMPLNFRVFLFSLLGAIVGGAVCAVIDVLFMQNVNFIFYIFSGMSAYAFYLYFIEKKEQKKFHLLLISIACILATIITVFIESMIFYGTEVIGSGNILQNTFLLYGEVIKDQGFRSYMEVIDGETQYHFSLLIIHILCAAASVIAMLLTSVVLRLTTNSWEKKHKGANVNYSYTSKKKKGNKKHK